MTSRVRRGQSAVGLLLRQEQDILPTESRKEMGMSETGEIDEGANAKVKCPVVGDVPFSPPGYYDDCIIIDSSGNSVQKRSIYKFLYARTLTV